MSALKGEVIAMRKPVAACRMSEIREATTGRVLVVLPRVCAVGETAAPAAAAPAAAAESSAESGVAFYRKYTEALLRRYQRMRLSTARVPSPMDREMFRGKMSHYRVQSFDDAVIFCIDVERCLARLNREDERLVRRIAVQQYTMGEAAGVLGVSLRSGIVLYRRALDRVTRMFLEARLLEPQKCCQEGESPGGGLSS